MNHTADPMEGHTTAGSRQSVYQRCKALIQRDSHLGELIRFGMTGGLATMLQYGVYVVFVDAVGVKAVPSTMISYAISFLFNFLMSTYFTFHTRPSTLRGIGFTLSHAINMGMQVGIVAIFKGIVGPKLALLPAFAICIPANFLMVRLVFTNKTIANIHLLSGLHHRKHLQTNEQSDSQR